MNRARSTPAPASGRGPMQRRGEECTLRLEGTDYPVHAVNHLVEDTMRLAELLEEEAHAAALTADALSPGEAESPQGYVDAFWGPDGSRFAAAEALMGALPPDIPYGRAPSGAPYYLPDALDASYADRVARDERVAVIVNDFGDAE